MISQTNAQGTHVFGYDGLGSTRILTDVNGVVQNSYGYQAFGELDYQHGTIENSYLFTGEQYDNNVGFYYLRARYYNPEIGRFQNMDTFPGMAFEPVTLHKYLYGNASPVMFVDPSGYFGIGGLSATQTVAAIIGGFAIAQIFEGTVRYGTDTRPNHDYDVKSTICYKQGSQDPLCNIENVYRVMLHCPAPLLGSNCFSEPIENGQFGYAHDWLPGGIVEFEINQAAFEHTNITTWAHTLHEGRITRWAEDAGGSITITTKGIGVNYTGFLAWMNNRFGAMTFRNLDRDIENYLEFGDDAWIW